MIVHEEITMETLPDPCPDTSYLQQEGYEERLRQAEDGIFSFIGVRASCTVYIGIGHKGHTIVHRIDSPGIWNVESDSNDSHIQELFENERSILLAMLDAMGSRHRLNADPSN